MTVKELRARLIDYSDDALVVGVSMIGGVFLLPDGDLAPMRDNLPEESVDYNPLFFVVEGVVEDSSYRIDNKLPLLLRFIGDTL